MKQRKKLVTLEYQRRERFFLDCIERHCNWWQKIYIRFAKIYGWNIWFLELCVKNPDICDFGWIREVSMKFDTGKFGVKINNVIYWML